MSNYLKSLEWSVVFAACHTVNQYWETLYGILQQLVHECIPMSRSRRSNNQHLPGGVRSFVLGKRKAWRRWRANPTTENKNIFNKVPTQRRVAVNAHRAQQEQRFLRCGPRKFFRYITN